MQWQINIQKSMNTIIRYKNEKYLFISIDTKGVIQATGHGLFILKIVLPNICHSF